MTMLFPKGSEWRKWDLHIHSPLSILANEYPKLESGEPDWEPYISRLESLDIAVIGVTDYFTIDGYKKILEFKQEGHLEGITILPNIEFRLDNVVASKKDGTSPRRLNLHVVFSDELSPEDIEEHFLHELYITSECLPQYGDFEEKLKSSNLVALGKTLIKENPNSFNRLTPLQVGAINATVKHSKISELLTRSERFKGKYLLILDEEYFDLIRWGQQDHQLRRNLLQKSDMLFTSNRKTIEWCLARPPSYQEGEARFLQEFKTLKPCIHGSDAHSLEFLGYPCAKRWDETHKCSENPEECDLRYCWIKADPTFEGLKQILYEPAGRVAIQTADPTPSRTNYTIKNVHISQCIINDELMVQETNLPFHHGLVAVTGGKGAGKTALVDLIANCFEDRAESNDPNSFVRRISEDAPRLKCTLDFQNAESFPKLVTENHFVQTTEVSYISQGELEEYVGEKSTLTDRINELIFTSPAVRNSLKKYEFDELQETLANTVRNLKTQSSTIVALEEQTKIETVNLLESQYKQLESDLAELDRKIKELQDTASAEMIEKAQQQQAEIDRLKSRRDSLHELKRLIEYCRHFIEDDLIQFNDNIGKIKAQLVTLGIEGLPSEIVYEDANLSELFDIVQQEISNVISEVEQSESTLEALEGQVQTHARLLDQHRDATAELTQVEDKQKQINSLKSKLIDEKSKRNRLFSQLLTHLLEQKNKYNEVIEQFSARKNEILLDLDFFAEIRFDKERFLQYAEDLFHLRKVNVSEDPDSDLADILRFCDELTQGDTETVERIVKESEELSESDLKEKLKPSKAIDFNDFYDFLYSNYFAIVPVVKYKNTSLERLSLGQKATVLIKIYLAQGDKPIIIDSHDDHLDNQFIMDELIGAIRQAKQLRQIIFVSNNGNIVINSDADQIIIAEREDTEISFLAGSLENGTIRHRSLEVLEGGEEAFKKRQQKYRLER